MASSSGEQALDLLRRLRLREDSVALLLVDQRMPGMNGTEFLAASRALFPDARRVLLTAYADTDAAIRAINDADVHHYLLKPWDPPEDRLYPVLDDLLETWRRPAPDGQPAAGRATAGPARATTSGEFLARNLVPYRWLDVSPIRRPGSSWTSRARDAGTLPVVVLDDGEVLIRPDLPVARGAHRPAGPGRARRLRPGRRRCRAGRAGGRRLRRLRGPVHPGPRVQRARRAGRHDQPDRELPRLPGRALRRRPDAARPRAGDPVRGGDPRARRGGRAAAGGPVHRGPAGRRQRGERLDPAHRLGGHLPHARRAGGGRAHRRRGLLRRLPGRGRRPRRRAGLRGRRRQLGRPGRGVPRRSSPGR